MESQTTETSAQTVYSPKIETPGESETSRIPGMVETSPIPTEAWGMQTPILSPAIKDELPDTELKFLLQAPNIVNPSEAWMQILRFNFMEDEKNPDKSVTQEQPRSYGRATKSPIRPVVINNIPFSMLSEKANGMGGPGIANRFPNMTQVDVITEMIRRAKENEEPSGVTGIKNPLIDMIITNELLAAGGRLVPSVMVVPFDKYSVMEWFDEHPEIPFPGMQILEYLPEPFISTYYRLEPNTARTADLWNPSPDRGIDEPDPDKIGRYSQRAILLRTFKFYTDNIDTQGIAAFATFYHLEITQVQEVYASFQSVLNDHTFELDLKGETDQGQDIEAKLPVNEKTKRAIENFLFLDSYFGGWNIGILFATSINKFDGKLKPQAGYMLDHFTGGLDVDWENNFDEFNISPGDPSDALNMYKIYTMDNLYNALNAYCSYEIKSEMVKALRNGFLAGKSHANDYFSSLGNAVKENSPLEKIYKIYDIQTLPKSGEVVPLNHEYQQAYDMLHSFLQSPVISKPVAEEYLQRIKILFSNRQQEQRAIHAASFSTMIRDTWNDFRQEKINHKPPTNFPSLFYIFTNGKHIFYSLPPDEKHPFVCALEPDTSEAKRIFSGTMKIYNPSSNNRNDFDVSQSPETTNQEEQIEFIKMSLRVNKMWKELQAKRKNLFPYDKRVTFLF